MPQNGCHWCINPLQCLNVTPRFSSISGENNPPHDTSSITPHISASGCRNDTALASQCAPSPSLLPTTIAVIAVQREHYPLTCATSLPPLFLSLSYHGRKLLTPSGSITKGDRSCTSRRSIRPLRLFLNIQFYLELTGFFI